LTVMSMLQQEEGKGQALEEVVYGQGGSVQQNGEEPVGRRGTAKEGGGGGGWGGWGG
jgi:hypothetical protein